MIQKPTWRTCAAMALMLPILRFLVITGERMGSKLVFSFCGTLTISLAKK